MLNRNKKKTLIYKIIALMCSALKRTNALLHILKNGAYVFMCFIQCDLFRFFFHFKFYAYIHYFNLVPHSRHNFHSFGIKRYSI
jgi:hypothetical protein